MRIISGIYKGRRFQLPKNLKARPTTDFAKEGLFNMLNNRIDFEDIRMLDLFAGTGSIGLEFLSRGAAHVDFIEQYPVHASFIRKVAEQLKNDQITVIQADAYRYIEQPMRRYDVIFADAPYADPQLPSLPERILSGNLLDAEGLLIVEHSSKISLNAHPGFIETRAYGSVQFSFFQHPKTETDL